MTARSPRFQFVLPLLIARSGRGCAATSAARAPAVSAAASVGGAAAAFAIAAASAGGASDQEAKGETNPGESAACSSRQHARQNRPEHGSGVNVFAAKPPEALSPTAVTEPTRHGVRGSGHG